MFQPTIQSESNTWSELNLKISDLDELNTRNRDMGGYPASMAVS